jgi:hypothetical protein
MSAVVSFVSDVVESVVDAVGDVVETVVDVVDKAVEFVGDTVQAVLDDPLPTLLSIAGSFVGIPPMVTNALITAARGGDIGDIALSVGTAYFAPTVSNSISSTLSASIGDALINETVSNVVVDGISKGLVNGTISEIRGGDFEDGFAGGFTGTIVGAGVGEVSNFVNESIFEELPDMGKFGDYAEKAVTSGITAEITGRGSFDTAFTNSVINSTANAGANYATSAINDQFNMTATTDQEITGAEEGDAEDERFLLTELDDSWAKTTGMVGTSAGLPDEIVEEVEVSDIGRGTTSVQDDPMILEAITEDETESTLIGYTKPDELGDSSLAEISEPENVDDLAEEYAKAEAPADVAELEREAAPEMQVPTLGGLSAVQPRAEESIYEMPAIEEQRPEAARQIDAFDEFTQNLVATPTEEAAPDIGGELLKPLGEIDKPLGGLQATLTQDAGTAGKSMVSGALNQILKPAFRQGITKALRRPATRPNQAPTRVAAKTAPRRLSADQMAAMQRTQPLQKIDINKVAPTKKPVAQKVDVAKLTPLKDITSLSALLAGGKGQG